MSSANIVIFECCSSDWIPLIYIKNNNGPKMLPCGTPMVIFAGGDNALTLIVCWTRPERYERNHSKLFPATPSDFWNFEIFLDKLIILRSSPDWSLNQASLLTESCHRLREEATLSGICLLAKTIWIDEHSLKILSACQRISLDRNIIASLSSIF